MSEESTSHSSSLRRVLTNEELKVLRGVVDGASVEQISASTELNTEDVLKALETACRKLRDTARDPQGE